jgi:hypothetical protein
MIYFGTCVDVFHALVMIVWIAGLPLLFWHRYPKLTIAYCIYSIIFIIINQLSQYFLGECILTTLARYYQSGQSDNEWFAVKFAKFIFGLTPTHKGVKIATEVLIAIAAVGSIYFYFFGRKKTK